MSRARGIPNIDPEDRPKRKLKNSGSHGRTDTEHWASPIKTYAPPWMWSWIGPPRPSEWLDWPDWWTGEVEELDRSKSLRRSTWPTQRSREIEAVRDSRAERWSTRRPRVRVFAPKGHLLKDRPCGPVKGEPDESD